MSGHIFLKVIQKLILAWKLIINLNCIGFDGCLVIYSCIT